MRRLFVSLLLLTACTVQPVSDDGTAVTSAAGVPFAGTVWNLTHLRGREVREVRGDRRPHLVFQEREGKVEGAGGCNRTSGTYDRSGAKLQFGPLMSTKMACADTALNEQEREFFALFQNVQRYELDGWTMTLYDGRGNELARFSGGK